MPDVAQLLQTLHPMREPAPPAPVAPYLTMLGLGVLAAAALLTLERRVRRRRRAFRQAAEAALAASRRLEGPERLAAQAQLLRGLVRTTRGEPTSRLGGAAWLATLDGTFGTDFFTRGEGSAYGEALYRREPHPPAVDRLDQALSRFIRQLKPTRA